MLLGKVKIKVKVRKIFQLLIAKYGLITQKMYEKFKISFNLRTVYIIYALSVKKGNF